MAIIHETKERRVVPNWRDFGRTIQLGELNPSLPLIPPIDFPIIRAIEDWRSYKTLGTAADLLNSAFVSGKINSSEVAEAIDFVQHNKDLCSTGMIDLVERIAKGNSYFEMTSKPNEQDIETINEFHCYINDKKFHDRIHLLKNNTKESLTNAIDWVELARFYSIKGQVEKAEKAIKTALHLAPSNRFVLRSATRFFIHSNSFEKALYYLKKCDNMSVDPWLISAHIATSSILGRYSPFIKTGKRLIDSRNYSNFDLTELASSIGTLEFSEGSFKKAKSFIKKSMMAPNDNSLAQLEWLSRHDQRFEVNLNYFTQVDNPFEAHALDLFKNGHWQDSFINIIKWFLDAPYSKRPIMLGSYIASALLDDKNTAIELCKVGLQANPMDPTLLNNMVFALVQTSQFDKVDKYLGRIKLLSLDSLPIGNKITLQATLGLIALKKKDFKTGLDLYERAIKDAKRASNVGLKNLAILNLTKELIRFNLPEKEYYKKAVLEMKINENELDIVQIRGEVLRLIKKDNP